MKQKIKKYLYLVNDVTSLILKKDRIEDEKNAEKLRTALIIVSVILVLSLVFNFYLFLR